jgi:hypothetical protein
MGRLRKRQREPKDRSFAQGAFNPDSTALRLYQALSDGQAQTCTARQTLLCAGP